MSALVWLQLLFLVFLAGVLLRHAWMIAFAVAVTLVFALADLWRKHALDKIHYSRRFHYTRGFPGETTSLQVSIQNKKLLPVSWLRLSDSWPFAVGPEDADVLAPSHIPEQGFLINLYSLRWYERITRSYTLMFRKRGIYPVGPAEMEAGDMFGLYEQRSELPKIEYLTVFPEMAPLQPLKLLAEDPFGSRRAMKPLFDDPTQPIGTRLYHPDDSFRHIHWPATAHTGSLQVKVYQPVSERMMVVCLNISTELHFWLGYSPAVLEQLVKVCAALVYQNVEAGYAVGLFANGCLAHADQPFRIPPGRSARQLGILLTALAGVTPYVTAPFETFLIRSMAEIPFGASLVIVSALVPESLEDTLIRLRRYRPNITLISLAQPTPRELPGIRTLHMPFDDETPAQNGKGQP